MLNNTIYIKKVKLIIKQLKLVPGTSQQSATRINDLNLFLEPANNQQQG